MNYKRLSLLIVLIVAAVSLFFFSSWTNAMVVSEGKVSVGVEALSKISPLLAGVLTVLAIGILVMIVVD